MQQKTKKDTIEERNGGFACAHCKKWVNFSDTIGTHHRNHCPYCLWSLHVDDKVSGDRKADCHSSMEPIGLTLKEEGIDKYGNKKQGDVMIIHQCKKCSKISINRIAADDGNEKILDLLNYKIDSKTKKDLRDSSIVVLNQSNYPEIKTALIGKNI
ncbi:MAG: RNHCP domain-containing protein [Patescibacteria group bacterium]|jgi:hypothetical protein